jgi:hypothetical protein
MADCKYYYEEFCVNNKCPMCADYCPVPDTPDVCKHEDRTPPLNGITELIEFIKKQTNVELKNIDGFCGDNPDLLYAEIPRKERNLVLSVCRKNGIETNEHLNGRYWFYVKGGANG